MIKQKLSVEIFRDERCEENNVSKIGHGIEYVNTLSDERLDIIESSRRLRFSGPSETLDVTRVRLSQQRADLNIIATDRKLLTPSEANRHTETLGVAIGANIPRLGRLAFVSTMENKAVASTTAHELAHLLNLKKEGDRHDGAGHCDLENCFMHKINAGIITRSERVTQRGLKAVLERNGLRAAEYRQVSTSSSNSFCDECVPQISKNTYFLQEFKNGSSIPPDWITNR